MSMMTTDQIRSEVQQLERNDVIQLEPVTTTKWVVTGRSTDAAGRTVVGVRRLDVRPCNAREHVLIVGGTVQLADDLVQPREDREAVSWVTTVASDATIDDTLPAMEVMA